MARVLLGRHEIRAMGALDQQAGDQRKAHDRLRAVPELVSEQGIQPHRVPARPPAEIAASENAAIVTPAWSPDGKKLAFTTILQNAANPNHSQHDIWTISADGSARHRITDGAGANLSPFWSVDNKVYFVSDRGGNECVWSASSDAATETVAVKHETKPAVEVKPESKAEPKTAVGTTDSHEVAH
jgi:dipeptidyl aminopeptidase/acylaminoacyl peptidase